jgi:hypothetical protein
MATVLACTSIQIENKVENEEPTEQLIIKLTDWGQNVTSSGDVRKRIDFIIGDSQFDKDRQSAILAADEQRRREVIQRLFESSKAGQSVEAIAYAQREVGRIWGDDQWEAFYNIIEKESGWVVGKISANGCAGLGQAMPASKLGAAFGDMAGEVDFFIGYCQDRYGSPNEAWRVWQSQRWW